MVKQKFLVHYSSSLIQMFVSTLAGIVVARLAGPTIMGTVAYGGSYVALFGIMLGLFGPSHLKLVSEGQDLGDCIKTYGILQSTLIFLYGVTFMSIYVAKNYIYGDGIAGNAEEIIILILFITNIIHYFLGIAKLTFAAKTELAKQSVSNLTESIAHSVLRVLVAILGFGAIALASTTLIAALIVTPLVLYYFKNYPIGRFRKELALRYFSVSGWFFIMSFCGIIITNLGKVLLKHYSSATELGIYSAGYSIAGVIQLFSATAGTIFFPHFSSLLSQNLFDKVTTQIYRYQRFIFLYAMPFVIIVSIFAKTIITTILGDKYLDSIPVMSLMVISSLIVTITMPYGNVITGAGRFKSAAVITVLRTAVFIISFFIFVSDSFLNLGGKGLALATLVSHLFVGLAYYEYSKKIIRHSRQIDIMKYLFLGVGCYFALYFLNARYFQNIGIIKTIIVSSLFVVAYYIIAYFLKLFDKEDILTLVDLLKPGKTTDYLKSELNERG